MENNITYKVIVKKGKPFMRMEAFGKITDMMIYKAKSEKPYVRYAGMFFYLDEDIKKELKVGSLKLFKS